MRAGRLRYRLMAERPVATETANGEGAVDWEPVTEVFADIEVQRGVERQEPSGVFATPHVKISARWRSSLAAMDSRWRLRQGEYYAYDLISVANADMANRELVIYAKGARLVEVVEPPPEPPTAYTLTALVKNAHGAGSVATLRLGWRLTASLKAGTGAGVAAVLRANRRLVASPRAGTGSGASATLTWSGAPPPDDGEVVATLTVSAP